jgi:hypothetical protein
MMGQDFGSSADFFPRLMTLGVHWLRMMGNPTNPTRTVLPYDESFG